MEIEYKFLMPEDKALFIMNKVQEENRCGDMDLVAMNARYFDTKDFSLQKRGIALRRRKENHDELATVKWGNQLIDGAHKRNEVNVPMIDVFPLDEHCFVNTEAEGLITEEEYSKLEEFLTMKFNRVQFDISCQDFKAIFSYDKGEIKGKNGSLPISEIEVELLSGSEKSFAKFCNDFKERYGLKPCEKSKFEQGQSLYF